MSERPSIPRDGPLFGTPEHRAALLADARAQHDFFRPSLDPAGGFHAQGVDGRPIEGHPRELHATTRMVHAFAIARLAGFEGCDAMIDHGMDALWRLHRDTVHGGYRWSFAPGGAPADEAKLAYGHAFVLLAGSSAKMVGHPDADRLIADILEVVEARFWERGTGRMREEFAGDWQPVSAYRGMNANMHMSEALLAAFEATGDRSFLARARGIFDFFVGEMGRRHGWRLPEHFDERWQVDPSYEGNPMFRPAGSTPGHSFEFARLILQLHARAPDDALRSWATSLYERALADGWDEARGGLVYTVDPQNGRVLRDNRYWWPVTEAIGAAAALIKLGDDRHGDYRRFWEASERLFIDREHGGWLPEARAADGSTGTQFAGKPDIYHSLQAALFPLCPGIAVDAHGLRAIEAARP